MSDISGQRIRQLILEQSKRANVGHIGSALSIADIMAVLFDGVLRGAPDSSERDRFVLSKGHAALALYAALHCLNVLSREQLATYCQDGSQLGTHPEYELTGIDFSTGSLGQGLSMGIGAALAARLDGSDRRVFVLLSDAECNEGSIWEGVMFAAQHKLSNLVVIIDDNGQQAMGKTQDVLNLRPFAARWGAFGWRTVDVDGHDTAALHEALNTTLAASAETSVPTVIIANTQAGYGVSYMQGQVRWHYMPMNDQEYQQALSEVAS